MRKDDVGAVYCFPFDSMPICLVLLSPHILIPALDDLLSLIQLIEEASDIILKVQVFEEHVEFHFDLLDELAATTLATFMSSKDYCDIGEWAFKASDLPVDIREIMNLIGDVSFED